MHIDDYGHDLETQSVDRVARHEAAQAEKAIEAALAPLAGKRIRATLPDGSAYDFPVTVIARDRALAYKDEFDNDLVKSLTEDTIPLFLSDDFQIEDWAKNNIIYGEVAQFRKQVKQPNPPDIESVWNGEVGSLEIVNVGESSSASTT